jgi:hypothetical protein
MYSITLYFHFVIIRFEQITRYLELDQFIRGRILGRNWDESQKSFPPCYAQSPLTTDFTPPTLAKSGVKLACDVNII